MLSAARARSRNVSAEGVNDSQAHSSMSRAHSNSLWSRYCEYSEKHRCTSGVSLWSRMIAAAAARFWRVMSHRRCRGCGVRSGMASFHTRHDELPYGQGCPFDVQNQAVQMCAILCEKERSENVHCPQSLYSSAFQSDSGSRGFCRPVAFESSALDRTQPPFLLILKHLQSSGLREFHIPAGAKAGVTMSARSR